VKVWRAHEVDSAARPEPGSIDADGVLGTASGALALDEVQPEGKRAMSAAAWRAGLRGTASVERV
jgi:methionyl-tRNA formyltransferase